MEALTVKVGISGPTLIASHHTSYFSRNCVYCTCAIPPTHLTSSVVWGALCVVCLVWVKPADAKTDCTRIVGASNYKPLGLLRYHSYSMYVTHMSFLVTHLCCHSEAHVNCCHADPLPPHRCCEAWCTLYYWETGSCEDCQQKQTKPVCTKEGVCAAYGCVFCSVYITWTVYAYLCIRTYIIVLYGVYAFID